MSGERQYHDIEENKSVKLVLPVTCTALAIVGTLANGTSLVYFIKKKDKTIGDKLLMLLNLLDLLLCIIATVLTVGWSYYLHTGQDVIFSISNTFLPKAKK